MSPEVAEQAASPWAARLTAVAIAAGISAGLGACSAPEHPPVSASASAGAEVAGKLPAAVCAMPKPGSANEKTAAQRCADALASGKLAVVNFDAPGNVVQSVDSQIGDLLSTATGGKVKLKVTGLNASSAAKDHLNKSITDPRGCIDFRKGEQLASTAADATMPELRNYDFILALTSKRTCADGVSGSTVGRHSDVFLGNMEDLKTPGAMLRGALTIGSHELGHQLKLGHAGTISVEVDGAETDFAGAGAEMGAPIDLGAFLRGKNIMYDEYGNRQNIMGVMTGPDYATPNTVQEAMLDWPKVILDGPEASPAEVLPPKAALEFSEQDAEAGKFAVLKLETPIKFEDPDTQKNTDGEAGSQQFTDLAVVPLMGEGRNYGVNLVLTNKDRAMATIGSPGHTPGEDNITIFTYGKQKIEVRLDGTTTTIREL